MILEMSLTVEDYHRNADLCTHEEEVASLFIGTAVEYM